MRRAAAGVGRSELAARARPALLAAGPDGPPPPAPAVEMASLPAARPPGAGAPAAAAELTLPGAAELTLGNTPGSSMLHGDERKQLGRVACYAALLCVYLLASVLLPTYLAKPLAHNFGLLPTTNLLFVAPMWILGTCLWRLAGDSRSAALFGVGWLISAFASFALGWADMQSSATVEHGISVREWNRGGKVADGYYFTDGYVGLEFQMTDTKTQCTTQHCSEHSWTLAPVFASPLCALLNTTQQVLEQVFNTTSGELLHEWNVTVPALNFSSLRACEVLFIAMQVEPLNSVGIIPIGLSSQSQGTKESTALEVEDMCGDSSSGGLCTRLSPYSPHACEPAQGSSARLPDPTLLGCAPRDTCQALMAQPFLFDGTNVCFKPYFAIGNLQKAADDGRTISAVMFGITALFFIASVVYKWRRDTGGWASTLHTLSVLSHGRRSLTRQSSDLVV